MHSNCLAFTLDRLHKHGGRMVVAGSVRGPLMHVWHESAACEVCRYEPDRSLRPSAGLCFFKAVPRFPLMPGRKPMWAVADGMAASAAYLGGSAADRPSQGARVARPAWAQCSAA